MYSRKLLGSLTTLFAGTFGSTGLALATQILLARAMPVADYGQLAAVLAAVNLLTPIGSLGLYGFWMQAFGREGAHGFRWVRPSLELAGIATTLCVMALSVYILRPGTLDAYRTVAVVVSASVILLGQCMVEMASARFQLEERFRAFALWQAAPQIGRFLVVLVMLLAWKGSFGSVMLAYAAVGLVLAGIGFLLLVGLVQERVCLVGHASRNVAEKGPPPPSRTETLSNTIPFALITIFYLLYFQSVVLLLSIFVGAEAAALYNAALLVIAATFLVPNIVFQRLLLARINRWAEHDRQRLASVFHVSVVAMAVAGIAVMIGVATTADFVVKLVFGAKYVEAAQVLFLLSFTIPVRFVQSAYGAVFVSQPDIRRKVRYQALSAVTCLMANMILLPWMGVYGAVVASIIAEISLLILHVWGLSRHINTIKLKDTFRLNVIRDSFKFITQTGAIT